MESDFDLQHYNISFDKYPYFQLLSGESLRKTELSKFTLYDLDLEKWNPSTIKTFMGEINTLSKENEILKRYFNDILVSFQPIIRIPDIELGSEQKRRKTLKKRKFTGNIWDKISPYYQMIDRDKIFSQICKPSLIPLPNPNSVHNINDRSRVIVATNEGTKAIVYKPKKPVPLLTLLVASLVPITSVKSNSYELPGDDIKFNEDLNIKLKNEIEYVGLGFNENENNVRNDIIKAQRTLDSNTAKNWLRDFLIIHEKEIEKHNAVQKYIKYIRNPNIIKPN